MSIESDENKGEDILMWYAREKACFKYDKRREILENWIDICAEEENYFLAAGLKRELDILCEEESSWCVIKRSIKKFYGKIIKKWLNRN